jgi:hypothetical protein
VISPNRNILTNAIHHSFVLAWLTFCTLLLLGVNSSGLMSFTEIKAYGLGHLDLDNMISYNLLPQSVELYAILPNIPQLVISCLYLLYNDLFTRFYLAKEWSSYSRYRKHLRVQFPKGAQRGSHFLSLPWRWSIPLLMAVTTLHWLASQSIFLSLIRADDYVTITGVPLDRGYIIVGCVWSPLGVILSLILGGCMITTLWLSCRLFKYGQRMPLVRSCSIAISAACHVPPTDIAPTSKALMYGVTENPDLGLVPHVCFTSGPVTSLVEGERYL